MKKGIKSFLSRFLVCFKGGKVSSSLIRPEIEEEGPSLELKAVICEGEPSAGLHVGEEIKLAGRREESAAGIQVGDEPATWIKAGEGELAAAIEAGEEPAMGIEAGEEEPAAGFEVGEEPAMGIEADEEEPAAGIGPGEKPTTGIEEDDPTMGIDPEEEAVTWIEDGEEDPAAGIHVGEEIKVGGWRVELAEGIQEPKVGIKVDEEEPAAEIKVDEEEPAAEIKAAYSLPDNSNSERQSGGGCGDGRWSSSLHSGFLMDQMMLVVAHTHLILVTRGKGDTLGLVTRGKGDTLGVKLGSAAGCECNLWDV